LRPAEVSLVHTNGPSRPYTRLKHALKLGRRNDRPRERPAPRRASFLAREKERIRSTEMIARSSCTAQSRETCSQVVCAGDTHCPHQSHRAVGNAAPMRRAWAWPWRGAGRALAVPAVRACACSWRDASRNLCLEKKKGQTVQRFQRSASAQRQRCRPAQGKAGE
jgi:hypothetical protein